MGDVGVHPPPSPARANYTLMTECTTESSGCYSVYSVTLTINFAGLQPKEVIKWQTSSRNLSATVRRILQGKIAAKIKVTQLIHHN